MSCSITKRFVLSRAQRKLVFQLARSGPSAAAGGSPVPLLGGHRPRASAQAWGGKRRVWAWGWAADPPTPGWLGSYPEDTGIRLAQVLARKVLPGHAKECAGRVQPPQPLIAAAADLTQKPICEKHTRGPPAGGAANQSGRRAQWAGRVRAGSGLSPLRVRGHGSQQAPQAGRGSSGAATEAQPGVTVWPSRYRPWGRRCGSRVYSHNAAQVCVDSSAKVAMV